MINDPSTYVPEAVGLAAETADRLSKSAHDAKDVAAEASRRAQVEFKKVREELARVAARTEALARANPWASAGTMLGVGIVLGAVGYRLFTPKPTLGRMLGVSGLPESARSEFKRQLKALKKLF